MSLDSYEFQIYYGFVTKAEGLMAEQVDTLLCKEIMRILYPYLHKSVYCQDLLQLGLKLRNMILCSM